MLLVIFKLYQKLIQILFIKDEIEGANGNTCLYIYLLIGFIISVFWSLSSDLYIA